MEETVLNVSNLCFQVIMDDKIVKSIELGGADWHSHKQWNLWLKVHLLHSLHKKEKLMKAFAIYVLFILFNILNGKKCNELDNAQLPENLHR